MYDLVIVDNPSPLVDMQFHYLKPDHLKDDIKKGTRVMVPFGNSKEPIDVIVTALSEECPGHVKRVNPIVRQIGSGPVLS